MRSSAESRTGRYLAVKGRRRIRQSFAKEFWDEVHALRADVGRLGTNYVRHAGVWLALGVLWWTAFLVLLIVLGASVTDALEATLEITFGITAPAIAVKNALRLTGASTPAAQFAGSIGWTVIIAFTMLIPALVALMLERLPNLVVTVRGLMDPEAWEFFSKYSTVLGRYLSAVSRSSTSPPPSREALQETRADAIATIAELVTFWYREEVELNANASFMRLVPGSASATRDLPALYGNGATVADSPWVLELTDWGIPSGDLPSHLVLFVDYDKPRPGAPFAVVKNRVDGITNALDRSEWRRHGLTDAETEEAVEYFRSVPFRSFVSIPVLDENPSDRPLGTLSIQVDRPNVFVIGKSETDDLVALIQRLCYFLAWLERMERNGDTTR
ncbi:MAG: hypothetical protein QOE82_2019 [Thermoanaerobaculia bacterium]|jgi:hypothetical protein|nr:hypothetical protein [Thermoanaerobaculia bacterium]